MRRLLAPIILIAIAILVWVCLVSPAMAASEMSGSISGKVYFNTGNQNIPNGTIVSLVNASNVSEYIPGLNVTPDQDGYFQFTNITNGLYKVYARSPYYTEGYSAGIDVTTNDTYTASVVLLAMPYYANITASTQSVRYGEKADATVQVNDYWGQPVGSGWQILLRTTVGLMDPDNALTDKDGKVYSKIGWVDNTTPAEITAFAASKNGSYYGLEENVVTPSPTITATPNATASPTAAPNATIVPSATATPVPTASVTPKPTPGFVLIAALAAIGVALAIRKNK